MLVQWKTLPDSPMPAEGRAPAWPRAPLYAHLQSILSCPRPFPPRLHTWLLAPDSVSNASLPPAPVQFPSPASYCAGLGALSHGGHWHAHHGTFIIYPPVFSLLDQPAMNLRVVPGTQLTHNTCWLRRELSSYGGNVYNARVL